MKKKVNGQTVDIDNIELFEKAAEGLAVNRTTISNVVDSVGTDFKAIEEYVNTYNSFYKSLPYPLYALDLDLKYAAIGCYIKSKIDKEIKVWVDNGLYICIDEDKGIALNFVNSTWGIVKVESIREDNTSLDIYKNVHGYEEIQWALDKISKGQSTSGYYKKFMEAFIKACNNQPMVLKWELGSILEFGGIPERCNFKTNKIIDLDSHNEYILDIFISGLRESKEKQHVWSLVDDDEVEPVMRPKYIKLYGFDVYEKISTADEDKIVPNEDKMTRCELYGATSLFNTLVGMRNASENDYFDDYTAFINEGNLVYVINNRVFVAKAYKYVEAKEVARGVELYAYDRGIVYFLKTRQVGRGVKKETIYSYSLRDGNLRLCKIQFTAC